VRSRGLIFMGRLIKIGRLIKNPLLISPLIAAQGGEVLNWRDSTRLFPQPVFAVLAFCQTGMKRAAN